jgi:hypothetical protein
MHIQYLIIEEDIEFPEVLSAKQLPGISLELNTYGNWKYCHNFTWLERGQRVFHCVLHPLCYNLTDMHKLTPNTHEVIAFSKWLSVKQNL